MFCWEDEGKQAEPQCFSTSSFTVSWSWRSLLSQAVSPVSTWWDQLELLRNSSWFSVACVLGLIGWFVYYVECRNEAKLLSFIKCWWALMLTLVLTKLTDVNFGHQKREGKFVNKNNSIKLQNFYIFPINVRFIYCCCWKAVYYVPSDFSISFSFQTEDTQKEKSRQKTTIAPNAANQEPWIWNSLHRENTFPSVYLPNLKLCLPISNQ